MGSNDVEDLEVVERDPTGRYVRFDEIIGESASKTVYKGFDEFDGIDIAWSKINLSDKIVKSKENLESLCVEANLLKSLKHENIVRCYHSSVDHKNKTINMITEDLTSGNLRQYRKKHSFVDNKAIKNWARQILKGLDYLHCHDPPIVHRDLKCEAVYLNGNSGRVKIGDLGLALILERGSPVRSFAGTPEFMAPELFDEDYDQLVDIYSFGMCLLQMVTRELPYSECSNPGQVYKKVISGVMPAALSKVTEPQVKQFIQKCLCPASDRPAAIDLLNDPFLALTASGTLTALGDLSLRESVCSLPSSTHDQMTSLRCAQPAASPVELVKKIETEKKIFVIKGKMKDDVSIFMTLWIGDLARGDAEKIEFVFALKTDSIVLLMEEMVRDLDFSIGDIVLVSELMKQLITELLPGSSISSLLTSNTEGDFNLRITPAEKPNNEGDFNLRITPAEKPSAYEYHDAGQLPDLSGVQDLTYQLISKDTNCIAFDQEISSTPSCPNKSQHKQNAKQEQLGEYENAERGNRECSKQVPKTHSSCLKKLLLFGRNKLKARSDSLM